MTIPSNKQLRKFISDHFDHDELHLFCFDYFPEMQKKFTENMSRDDKAVALIKYCDRKFKSREELLANLESEREALYHRAFETQRRSKNYNQDLEILKNEIKEEKIATPPPSEPQIQQQESPNPVPDTQVAQSENKLQQQEAQVIPLYNQLIQAQVNSDWVTVLTLAAQIDNISPNYQDVVILKSVALQQFQKSMLPDVTATELSEPSANKTEDEPAAKPTPQKKVEEDTKPPKTAPVKNSFVHEKTGLEFIRIPAGTFIFGNKEEKHLPEYWISKTPVTNEVYQKFINANPKYKVPKAFLGGDNNWNKKKRAFKPELAEHPVAITSWEDAVIFCSWAGLELPTEEEWEKAARGTDGRAYPWGNNAPTDQLCNVNNIRTSPVGHYSPLGDSPYGCMDMSGNVREWCLNKMDNLDDTIIDDSGAKRGLRGGSYLSDQDDSRITHQSYGIPNYGEEGMGIRVVIHDPGPIIGEDMFVHERIGLGFVRVPAGKFTFGKGENAREIDLPEYWISRTPVTNIVYQQFIDANPKYKAPKMFLGGDYNWDKKKRTFKPELADHPVVVISWNDAIAFCEWAELQLPTEEQWEKAARGTDGRTYPWGNDDPTEQLCNFSKIGTSPVGYFSPFGDSPYNCIDMSGNIREWCLNKAGDQGDAIIDASGDARALRNGSYWDDPDSAETTYNVYSTPDYGDSNMGFRVIVQHRPS